MREEGMRAARRFAIAAVWAVIAGVAPLHAQAPVGDGARAITVVVPIAAGGGMDTIGRTMAERLQERLKQPVVVENRVGAGGVVGVDYVAKGALAGRIRLLVALSAGLLLCLLTIVPLVVAAVRAPGRRVAAAPAFPPAPLAAPAADARALGAYARAHPG